MTDSILAIPQHFQISMTSWIIAIVAAFILGLSKAGVKGIGIIIVIMLAIVFGAKASTGILLPLLIFADVFAVSYYNRHTEWKHLRILLPWMVLGVLLGVWVGKGLPEEQFRRGLAIVVIVCVIMMFWWDRRTRAVPKNKWFGAIMGLSAGFATMIGNSAGPLAIVYFLAMRLPKNSFIGTAAWLFFIINLFKLPFHIWVWETVSFDSLAVNVRLLLPVVAGFFLGVWIVKKIEEDNYRRLILALTAAGAALILFQ